jgi:Domain of unknown function (DUF5668)
VSRYILIRRLRGPAILLLIGVIALLHQMGVVEHFWHLFWPLLFILLGVILLAERAILTIDGPVMPPPYPDGPYPGSPYAGSPYGSAPYAGAPYTGAPTVQTPTTESTAIVPAHSHDFDDESNGGRS